MGCHNERVSMLHYWRGKHPHRRQVNEIGARGRVMGTSTVLIQPGETFEPTEAELQGFRDLMEPVGHTLRGETSTTPDDVQALA